MTKILCVNKSKEHSVPGRSYDLPGSDASPTTVLEDPSQPSIQAQWFHSAELKRLVDGAKILVLYYVSCHNRMELAKPGKGDRVYTNQGNSLESTEPKRMWYHYSIFCTYQSLSTQAKSEQWLIPLKLNRTWLKEDNSIAATRGLTDKHANDAIWVFGKTLVWPHKSKRSILHWT